MKACYTVLHEANSNVTVSENIKKSLKYECIQDPLRIGFIAVNLIFFSCSICCYLFYFIFPLSH